MTRADQAKAFNRVRDIEVAVKGLLKATGDYRTKHSKTAAVKAIQERIARLTVLADQLSELVED